MDLRGDNKELDKITEMDLVVDQIMAAKWAAQIFCLGAAFSCDQRNNA